MMGFLKAQLLLRLRLVECGIPPTIRDEAVEKMICEGAVLLIDRTGKDSDRITWVKPKEPAK